MFRTLRESPATAASAASRCDAICALRRDLRAASQPADLFGKLFPARLQQDLAETLNRATHEGAPFEEAKANAAIGVAVALAEQLRPLESVIPRPFGA